MNSKDAGREKAAELRQRAEELVRGKGGAPPENLEALLPQEMRKTLQELRVHQIELELQNEELARAQTELDAARARYFDLYDLAPVGYCTLSLEGLILEANLTAVTLLGVTRAELVKQPITRFILKDDQDIYYLHRKQYLKTGEPSACELRMLKKDGTTFWARLMATAMQTPSASPGNEAEGPPVSRFVVSDITERKQAEEELAKLVVQLQHSQKDRHTGLKTRRD